MKYFIEIYDSQTYESVVVHEMEFNIMKIVSANKSVWFISENNIMGGMKIPEDLHTPIQQEILLDYRSAGGTFSDICVKGIEV